MIVALMRLQVLECAIWVSQQWRAAKTGLVNLSSQRRPTTCYEGASSLLS